MSSPEPVKHTYQELQQENEDLKAQVLLLTNELARLKKLISGAKSERFIPSENALQLALQGSDSIAGYAHKDCLLTL